jgi:1-acyl-sn-glycerol-3-phosphate acyltransferase
MRIDPHSLNIHASATLARGLFCLFGGLEVRGLENVPKTGPALIAANHLSWADGPALRAALRRRNWFLVKASLFHVPVLGWLLPLYGAFPLKQEKPDPAAMLHAEEHLKQGEIVCAYPEGGVSHSGRLGGFKKGVAFLALRSGAPLIPAAITGTERVLPPGTYCPRYAQEGVRVTFGPALRAQELAPAEPDRHSLDALTRRLRDAVTTLLPSEYVD